MLGWIGWAMVFIGVYLIGRKNITGFYFNVVAGLFINIDAVMYEHWSLFTANTALMGMNIWNIYKWRKLDGTKIQS